MDLMNYENISSDDEDLIKIVRFNSIDQIDEPIPKKQKIKRPTFKKLIDNSELLKGIKLLILGNKRPTELQYTLLSKLRDNPNHNLFLKARLFSSYELSYLIYAHQLIDQNSDKVQVVIICPTNESVNKIYNFSKLLFQFTNISIKSSSQILDNNIYNELKNERINLFITTIGAAMAALSNYLDRKLIKLVIIEESESLTSNPKDKKHSTILKMINLMKLRLLIISSFVNSNLVLNSIRKLSPTKLIILDHLDVNSLFRNILNFYVPTINEYERYGCLVKILNNTLSIKKKIINVNSKEVNLTLVQRLREDKFINVFQLSSDIKFDDRLDTIERFKSVDFGILVNCYPILINIELENIKMIINYDLFMDSDRIYYQKISNLECINLNSNSVGFAVNLIDGESSNQTRLNKRKNLEDKLPIKLIKLDVSN